MNYFVFVVCGSSEYIEQLNFSLKYLRYFSHFPILVVTDTARNEILIEHDQIIDVKTPEYLNNHQAHLFIETRLVNYINPEPDDIYCYLDSDVIALNESINDVFEYFTAPISFAGDHCTIDFFSPKIMHCGCQEHFANEKALSKHILSLLPFIDYSDEETSEDAEKLLEWFNRMKPTQLEYLPALLRYVFLRHFSKKPEFEFKGFYFHRKNACWYSSNGNLVGFDFNFYNKLIFEQTGVRFDGTEWVDKNKNIIKPNLPECTHLRDYLNSTYSINIPSKFRHWNGGVFLFSHESAAFMEFWHQATMAESVKGKIKYYDDQSTLIATAFHFGTQNNEYLPNRFNFIADFYQPDIKWDYKKGYTLDNFKTIFNPALIHVYHHWGDKTWDIWQSVIKLGKECKIID